MTRIAGPPQEGQGASADADRATRASTEPQERLGHMASVPSADALVKLMSAWGSRPATKFYAAYPFFEGDRRRIIAEYLLLDDDRAQLEATALLFAEYADEIYVASAIEARRAADSEAGTVGDESAVPERQTPNPTTPSSQEPSQ